VESGKSAAEIVLLRAHIGRHLLCLAKSQSGKKSARRFITIENSSLVRKALYYYDVRREITAPRGKKENALCLRADSQNDSRDMTKFWWNFSEELRFLMWEDNV
jgi:hypothetical protein